MYKGISGTLMLTESFAAYGPFYKTGAHKGQCDTSNNATPLAEWGSVTGEGPVKFRLVRLPRAGIHGPVKCV